jgi:hypothetical protein
VRLLAESGLWSTGPTVSPAPAVAVLEVSGAVLAWTVDDSSDSVRITFTDVSAAEWLWRFVGVSGHAAVSAAVDGRTPGEDVDLDGIDLLPEPVNRLRRLALGHWMRRWWPASAMDGIADLDRSILDGEVALLTSAAEDYFTDDTFDSDVVELLAPHKGSLLAHERAGDPRVVELARACLELAGEVGAWDSSESDSLDSMGEVEASSGRRRDDYALAAGAEVSGSAVTAIAAGVGSVDWMAVPPGVFDAADGTVQWSIEMAGAAAAAVVRVAPLGRSAATGIAVGVSSGTVSGMGHLDEGGRATVSLKDDGQLPLAEGPAWNHDWSTTTVRVGADLDEPADAAETRQRVRALVRRRLATPGPDAFLAEILAAESDY